MIALMKHLKVAQHLVSSYNILRREPIEALVISKGICVRYWFIRKEYVKALEVDTDTSSFTGRYS